MKGVEFSLSDKRSAYEELYYIRKILCLLLIQVSASCIVAVLFSTITPIYEFVESRFWLALIIKIGLVPITFVLFKVECVSSNLLLSSIFFIIFTIGLGAMLGTLLAVLGLKYVIIVLSFFLSVHVVTFFHSILEQEEYNLAAGIISVAGISAVNISVLFYIVDSNWLWISFVPFVTGFYGAFIVFHSKMISEGKLQAAPRERYILGTLSVYVDLFLLKFYIVKWCCTRSKEEEESDYE